MSSKLKTLCRDLALSFSAALLALLTQGQSPMDALLALGVAALTGAINALDPTYGAYGRSGLTLPTSQR